MWWGAKGQGGSGSCAAAASPGPRRMHVHAHACTRGRQRRRPRVACWHSLADQHDAGGDLRSLIRRGRGAQQRQQQAGACREGRPASGAGGRSAWRHRAGRHGDASDWGRGNRGRSLRWHKVPDRAEGGRDRPGPRGRPAGRPSNSVPRRSRGWPEDGGGCAGG